MVNTRGSLVRTARAANNQPGGVQPRQTPAGMGTLDKLPPEIRNRIYKFVLVESERVKLQSYQPTDKLHYVVNGKRTSRIADKEVAPVDHKRDSDHRGQKWNGDEWIEIPSKTALTMVNKQLNAETSSILYGFNDFDFTTTVSLERFLNQIGDNKKYLRAVGLICSPTGHQLASGSRAMTALMVARSLHTLSVTHLAIEIMDVHSEIVKLSIQDHVEMFAPLLSSLHASLQARGRGADILDVVKIKHRLPGDRPHRAEISCPGYMHCRNTCFWHDPEKTIYHLDESDCSDDECIEECQEYRARYAHLKAVVREAVATKLGIALPDVPKE